MRRIARFIVCAGVLFALTPVANAEDNVHVVQAGETLSGIAADAGVDVDALVKLNGLDDANVLRIGQSLRLAAAAAAPAAPVAKTYTVVEGDTLWDIAMRLNTTTAALVEANHLEDADRLTLGAQLVLPKGVVAATAAASVSPTPTAATNRTRLVPYTVQSGETLNQIARRFDVKAEVIVKASGLEDPNRLAVGAVLKVPLPGHERVVVAGETLRDIALQEKVDLGSLIDFNQIDDPELIRVGQVVLVPPAGESAAVANAPKPDVQTAKPEAQVSAPAAKPEAQAPKPAAPQAQQAAAVPPRPTAAPKPSAPIAVVAAPKDAPKDGLVGAGLKLLGSPYVWGGSSPAGFDCSGFIWYVAKQIGRPLSRGMLGEYNSGSHPSREELKPGDLVFFQNTYSPGLSHNGIYVGNGQFVHAADEAAGVTISSLNTAYWSSHWFGATRLP